jgi:hypothetical protein
MRTNIFCIHFARIITTNDVIRIVSPYIAIRGSIRFSAPWVGYSTLAGSFTSTSTGSFVLPSLHFLSLLLVVFILVLRHIPKSLLTIAFLFGVEAFLQFGLQPIVLLNDISMLETRVSKKDNSISLFGFLEYWI